MAELATKRMCKDVQAIYFYDMIGKYLVICAYLKQILTVGIRIHALGRDGSKEFL